VSPFKRTQCKFSHDAVPENPTPPFVPGGPRPEQDKRPTLVAYAEGQISYSGPAPLPSILRGYEEIVPGSAARILEQVNRQTDHRIDLENRVVNSDIARSKLGLWLGFFLSAMSIGGGCVVAGFGHDTAGAFIATTGVAALATVFVHGTNARRREREAKAKLIPLPRNETDGPISPRHEGER